MRFTKRIMLMKPISEQIILVTGATDGLGKGTALALAQSGATVLLHGRDQTRLETARQEIFTATGNDRLEIYRADFVSLDEVRSLAQNLLKHHPRLDMLINNAGIVGGSAGETQRKFSQEGYELVFAVNYLAPFLLTLLLLPALRHTPPSRIINVTSAGQSPIQFDNVMMERGYEPLAAYRQSKLAQVMFTIDLADRLKNDQITVNSLHPASLMPTKMVFEYFGRTMSSIEDGVNAVTRLATDPSLDTVTGKYFDEQREARANAQAYDADARRQLWQLSEELTGLG
jgi:NAD(P)-dependent dehydrogenase (short-subunit alcohol dehydrogenase family)